MNSIKKYELSIWSVLSILIHKGYIKAGNLVVDFRQIIDIKEFGYPVVMDVTHST